MVFVDGVHWKCARCWFSFLLWHSLLILRILARQLLVSCWHIDMNSQHASKGSVTCSAAKCVSFAVMKSFRDGAPLSPRTAIPENTTGCFWATLTIQCAWLLGQVMMTLGTMSEIKLYFNDNRNDWFLLQGVTLTIRVPSKIPNAAFAKLSQKCKKIVSVMWLNRWNSIYCALPSGRVVCFMYAFWWTSNRFCEHTTSWSAISIWCASTACMSEVDRSAITQFGYSVVYPRRVPSKVTCDSKKGSWSYTLSIIRSWPLHKMSVFDSFSKQRLAQKAKDRER